MLKEEWNKKQSLNSNTVLNFKEKRKISLIKLINGQDKNKKLLNKDNSRYNSNFSSLAIVLLIKILRRNRCYHLLIKRNMVFMLLLKQLLSLRYNLMTNYPL